MKKIPSIYIVEDSAMVQYMIELNLKDQFDCIIHKFSNVKEAILAIRKNVPDVVVLDYSLDVGNKKSQNGLDFLKQLKKLKIKIPTVVFSGQRDQTIADDLIRNGAVDYVSKDSGTFLEDLVESVQSILVVKDEM